MKHTFFFNLMLGAAFAFGACADSGSSMDTAPPSGGQNGNSMDPSYPDDDEGSNGGAGEGDSNAEPPPAEDKIDYDLGLPEAGESLLYLPSTYLHSIFVVDGQNLNVDSVEVGLNPTIVLALPGNEGAVVLNEGSSSVSIVRPIFSEDGEISTYDYQDFPVLPGANRLVLSPDGDYAFAFHVSTNSPYGSLQDVSLLRLSELEEGLSPVINLSVGLRPSEILFTQDQEKALIVCEDGISVALLEAITKDQILPPLPTNTLGLTVQSDRRLVLDHDGTRVFIRDLDSRGITLLDLESEELSFLRLPDYASDLVLTKDGNTLLVPMINSQQVALIDAHEAFSWASPKRLKDNGSPPDPKDGEGEDEDVLNGEEDVYEPEEDVQDEDVYEPQEDVQDEDVYEPQEDVQDEDVHEPQEDVQDEDVYEPQEDVQDEDVHEPQEDVYEPQEDVQGEEDLSTGEDDAGDPEDPLDNPFISFIDSKAPFGSTTLTASNDKALLYTTNASVLEVAYLDLDSLEVSLKAIPKAIRSVAVSPNSRFAVLLHRKDTGEGDLYGREAFSMYDLETGYTKLFLPRHAISSFVFTRDAKDFFALIPDPAGRAHQLERVNTESFSSSTYPLPDKPVYIGLLPLLQKVVVSLDNPTGWLTFIDLISGEVKQLNSFELNGFIR